MNADLLTQLRACEGAVVRLASTEGEILPARVLYVSEEEVDVIVDILSTNQPERCAGLGKKYQESAWAIPFAFTAKVECDATAEPDSIL